MKKQEIVNLVNAGCLSISNHSLDPTHAYKVVKFRKALRSAADVVESETEAIRQDVGIKDGAAFDKELFSLRGAKFRSEDQQKRLDEMEATFLRFKQQRDEMFKEECELKDMKPLPYEEWHKLQAENKEKEIAGRKVDVLSGQIEDLLEGILWEAPGEE